MTTKKNGLAQACETVKPRLISGYIIITGNRQIKREVFRNQRDAERALAAASIKDRAHCRIASGGAIWFEWHTEPDITAATAGSIPLEGAHGLAG